MRRTWKLFLYPLIGLTIGFGIGVLTAPIVWGLLLPEWQALIAEVLPSILVSYLENARLITFPNPQRRVLLITVFGSIPPIISAVLFVFGYWFALQEHQPKARHFDLTDEMIEQMANPSHRNES